MRQLRDNEIVIALIAGAIYPIVNTGKDGEDRRNQSLARAEAIVAEVIRRGDEAES